MVMIFGMFRSCGVEIGSLVIMLVRPGGRQHISMKAERENNVVNVNTKKAHHFASIQCA